jgi:hypothetical protein
LKNQRDRIRASDTSGLTRDTRRHIPKDGILLSHRCENLKSVLRLYNSHSVLRTVAKNALQSMSTDVAMS